MGSLNERLIVYYKRIIYKCIYRNLYPLKWIQVFVIFNNIVTLIM